MLLQSKAPTSCVQRQHSSSSQLRRVRPIATARRLVVADASLKETAAVPVMEKGELSSFPEQPAVYAVFDKEGAVQYIGLTRKVILCTLFVLSMQHSLLEQYLPNTPATGSSVATAA